MDDQQLVAEESRIRTRKQLIAVGIILVALGLLVLKAGYLTNNDFLGDLLQSVAIGMAVFAAVDLYYGTASTERYFENRFFIAMKKALLLDEDYLVHLDQTELATVLDSLMGIMSGKAKGHPDHGLYETVRTNVVPVLGQPYRKDFNVMITQDPVTVGGKTYFLTKTVTDFHVVNPTDDAIDHEIPLWAKYPTLPGIDESKLFSWTKVSVGGRDRPVTPQRRSEDGQVINEASETVTVLSGKSVAVHLEDEVFLESDEMDTFRPACAIMGLKLSIFPAPGCKANLDFFGFEQVGDGRVLPRDGCFWQYKGWLLPPQGYAIRYRNIS